MVAALYVMPDGPYAGISCLDLWDESRDARKYRGPDPVVAHPPCQRWGRYWHGAPNNPHQFRMGEDGGCFAAAMTAVRNYGGVLEHPAYSHAWRYFGLTMPPASGGWVRADDFGGWTCHVEQGHYGHLSRKATWLYAVGTNLPELTWGPSEQRIHPVALKRYGYAKARRIGMMAMVGGKDKTRIRNATPPAFRDLLLSIAKSAPGQPSGTAPAGWILRNTGYLAGQWRRAYGTEGEAKAAALKFPESGRPNVLPFWICQPLGESAPQAAAREAELRNRGWATWYNAAYWVHPKTVLNPDVQDYTNYGMSLDAAYAWEMEGGRSFPPVMDYLTGAVDRDGKARESTPPASPQAPDPGEIDFQLDMLGIGLRKGRARSIKAEAVAYSQAFNALEFVRRWLKSPHGEAAPQPAQEANHCETCHCGKRAPVQGNRRLKKGSGHIAWAEHLEAYGDYSSKYGTSQSAARMAERGGFCYGELVEHLGRDPKTWVPGPIPALQQGQRKGEE